MEEFIIPLDKRILVLDLSDYKLFRFVEKAFRWADSKAESDADDRPEYKFISNLKKAIDTYEIIMYGYFAARSKAADDLTKKFQFHFDNNQFKVINGVQSLWFHLSPALLTGNKAIICTHERNFISSEIINILKTQATKYAWILLRQLDWLQLCDFDHFNQMPKFDHPWISKVLSPTYSSENKVYHRNDDILRKFFDKFELTESEISFDDIRSNYSSSKASTVESSIGGPSFEGLYTQFLQKLNNKKDAKPSNFHSFIKDIRNLFGKFYISFNSCRPAPQ